MSSTKLLALSAVVVLLVSGAARPNPQRAPRMMRGLPAGMGAITRTYDVRLAYVGYTGLAKSLDCLAMVDTLGYDSLTGTLTGFENPAEPDEDVVYTGTLRRVTKIDFCETKPNPTPDQLAWCKAKLNGAARWRLNSQCTAMTATGPGSRPSQPRPRTP